MKKVLFVLVSVAVALFLVACPTPTVSTSQSYSMTVDFTGAEDTEGINVFPNPAKTGELVTLTATLESDRQVTLRVVKTSSLEEVSLSQSVINTTGGTATFTMPSEAVTITAVFEARSEHEVKLEPSGSISGESIVASSNPASAGELVTLTATLESDRQVTLRVVKTSSLEEVSLSQSVINITGGTATFTMPSEAVTITAVFEARSEHEVKLEPSGSISGESIVASSNPARAGELVTLTATLESDRQVTLRVTTESGEVSLSQSVINTTGGTATFTMPSEAVTITAVFEARSEHEVKLEPSGSISGESIVASSNPARAGELVTLTATLESDRQVTLRVVKTSSLEEVSLSQSVINITGGTATFTMPSEAVKVSADFDFITYDVTVIPQHTQGDESIVALPNPAKEGEEVTLTATLETDRQVVLSATTSSGDVILSELTITTNGGTATFTMPADVVEVSATFGAIPRYEVKTTDPVGNQNAEDVFVLTTQAMEGEEVELVVFLLADRQVEISVTKNSGEVILSEVVSTNNATVSFIMPAETVTVAAVFDFITYDVTVIPQHTQGDESIVALPNPAKEGELVTLTATLEADRQVTLRVVKTSSLEEVSLSQSVINITGGTATFTMPSEAVKVTADFDFITYDVTVTPQHTQGDESIVALPNPARAGELVTLTATLESDRQVELSATTSSGDVILSELIITTNGGTATFTMPADVVEVTADFDFITYDVTVTPQHTQGDESIVALPNPAKEGEEVTLTATLETDRQVVLSATTSSGDVILSELTITTNGGTATFTMPADVVEVSATFGAIPRYEVKTTDPVGNQNAEDVFVLTTQAMEGEEVELVVFLLADRQVEISVTKDSGEVILSEVVSTNNATVSFIMPAETVTVAAVFDFITYDVTVIPQHTQGDESIVALPNPAKEGELVTLTATLEADRQVTLRVVKTSSLEEVSLSQSVINITGGTATFTMPSEAVKVTADFDFITYDVTVTPQHTQGDESIVALPNPARAGELVTLTATLESDRQVELSATTSSGDVILSELIITTNGGTATFTMPADVVEVTADFDFITYDVTVTSQHTQGDESIVALPNPAKEGEEVTLTATLETDRQVVLSATTSSGDVILSELTITTNGGTATFTMPADVVEVSATFGAIPRYEVKTTDPVGNQDAEDVFVLTTQAMEGEEVELVVFLLADRQVEISVTKNSGEVILSEVVSTNNATVSFIMPAETVTVAAVFGDKM